jgi:hypothetical protein
MRLFVACTNSGAADEARAVSLAMPTRLASYEQAFGLHPIFEMNLPEGALRERLRLAFARRSVGSTISMCWRSRAGREWGSLRGDGKFIVVYHWHDLVRTEPPPQV